MRLVAAGDNPGARRHRALPPLWRTAIPEPSGRPEPIARLGPGREQFVACTSHAPHRTTTARARTGKLFLDRPEQALWWPRLEPRRAALRLEVEVKAALEYNVYCDRLSGRVCSIALSVKPGIFLVFIRIRSHRFDTHCREIHADYSDFILIHPFTLVSLEPPDDLVLKIRQLL